MNGMSGAKLRRADLEDGSSHIESILAQCKQALILHRIVFQVDMWTWPWRQHRAPFERLSHRLKGQQHVPV